MNTSTLTDPTVSLARRAGIALGLAALLAIAGFTALGTVFAYPRILAEPVDDILVLYRSHQASVMFWFGALVLGAALMAPAGIWIGRLASGGLGRAIAAVGVAAAVVQVVGLQRWLTMVPSISRDALDPAQHDAAVNRFSFWHTLLGTAIGETVGYALTATFTILVVVALRRLGLPRWAAASGVVAAVLIATGVLIPILPIATLTNFAGYVVWCVWVLAVALILVRGLRPRPEEHTQSVARPHAM